MTRMFTEPVTRPVVVTHVKCGSTKGHTDWVEEKPSGSCTHSKSCSNHVMFTRCNGCGNTNVSGPVYCTDWKEEVDRRECGCRTDWPTCFHVRKWCGCWFHESDTCRHKFRDR